MTDRERLAEIAADLDGALRMFAGMCATYPMPKTTFKAFGAFAECLGSVAAKCDPGDEPRRP